MKNDLVWKEFITDTGIRAKYAIIGDDNRFDVKIKIVSPIPKTHYYSALNEAGIFYEETILPTIQ